jgi:hypothetical protein
MRATAVLAVVSLSVMAGHGHAAGDLPVRSRQLALGVSLGAPAALNLVAAYDPHWVAVRLSGMHYGALRGVQLSVIPLRLSSHDLSVGVSIAGGHTAVRHGVGPMSHVVTDEVSYVAGGLSLSWRGLFLEPAVWWGRTTTTADSGPLIQLGYVRGIR